MKAPITVDESETRVTPSERSILQGATVLITGAGMGMGELYARKAAAAGARALALWDIDLPRVSKVAAELEAQGVMARGYGINVADAQAVREGVRQVHVDFGAVDVLINNAGIVKGGPFWEHDPHTDIERTMEVNTLGPMWLTREVLPSMMHDTSKPKRILNIASAAGTLANPNMSVYAASKWAMIGWSESLRLELEKKGYTHVKVTTFCPSFISTGMFAGARGPLLTPIMTPDIAVRAAWNGMLRGTPLVTKPWTVKLAMALRGVLPTKLWDSVARSVFQVYSSMDAFTGRTTEQQIDSSGSSPGAQ